MDYLSLFNMPKQASIAGRSSTITNAFIGAITPKVQPSESEVKEALSILKMTLETIQCAYCGEPKSEWDHLRPLVLNKHCKNREQVNEMLRESQILAEQIHEQVEHAHFGKKGSSYPE